MKFDALNIVSILFFCTTFIPVTIVMTGTALTLIGIL